jgi:hypothetical protein
MGSMKTCHIIIVIPGVKKKQGKDLFFQGNDFLLVLCLPGRQVASVTHIG